MEHIKSIVLSTLKLRKEGDKKIRVDLKTHIPNQIIHRKDTLSQIALDAIFKLPTFVAFTTGKTYGLTTFGELNDNGNDWYIATSIIINGRDYEGTLKLSVFVDIMDHKWNNNLDDMKQLFVIKTLQSHDGEVKYAGVIIEKDNCKIITKQ